LAPGTSRPAGAAGLDLAEPCGYRIRHENRNIASAILTGWGVGVRRGGWESDDAMMIDGR